MIDRPLVLIAVGRPEWKGSAWGLRAGSRTRRGRRGDVHEAAGQGQGAGRGEAVLMRASQAGTDQAIEGKPELAYLRTALAVACGKWGSSFGTPIGIEIMITRMLGESTYSPEEEPTT